MTPSAHDADHETPDVIARRFAEFAHSYSHLTLYAAICRPAASDRLAIELLGAARPGQARPVLLLAALHDLVLRRPDLPVARWYPSVTGDPVPAGDPWPDVRAALAEHADELREVIGTRATQTNEVNRVVHVSRMVAEAAADLPDRPVALVELGASAGLLLGLDRYRIEVEGPDGLGIVGDPASAAVAHGVQGSGPAAPTGFGPSGLPPIVERVGLDREPVDLDDVDGVRWLEACLWPDQPARLARFRAAVEVLRADPPTVVAGDMVDDLEPTLHAARAVAAAVAGGTDVHLVVFSSWALTYVARERRGRVADVMAALAGDDRPVSWLTAEPPGAVPGIPVPPGSDAGLADARNQTALGLRRWRDGVELPPVLLGTCHPHGERFDLQP